MMNFLKRKKTGAGGDVLDAALRDGLVSYGARATKLANWVLTGLPNYSSRSSKRH